MTLVPVDTFWSVAHDRFAICRHHAGQHLAASGSRRATPSSLAAYYRDVLGLAELSRADGTIMLGAGERPLLVHRSGSGSAAPTIRERQVSSTPPSCCRRAPISAAG